MHLAATLRARLAFPIAYIRSLSKRRRASRTPRSNRGIELNLATPQELLALILAEEFVLQLHIGALLLAGMRGYLDLASFR